jgi:hypothetical protein
VRHPAEQPLLPSQKRPFRTVWISQRVRSRSQADDPSLHLGTNLRAALPSLPRLRMRSRRDIPRTFLCTFCSRSSSLQCTETAAVPAFSSPGWGSFVYGVSFRAGLGKLVWSSAGFLGSCRFCLRFAWVLRFFGFCFGLLGFVLVFRIAQLQILSI